VHASTPSEQNAVAPAARLDSPRHRSDKPLRKQIVTRQTARAGPSSFLGRNCWALDSYFSGLHARLEDELLSFPRGINMHR
jgi:hypothetical protein